MRVLLVDDDRNLLHMLSRVLTIRGHEVEIAESPYGVAAHVQRYRPDLVLLDVMMPGLSGSSLARVIGGLEGARRPAILLYSAMPEDQLAEAAKSAKVPYIPKTRGPMAIVKEIERYAPAR
jgi:DNA-binding response OmpR family regulator